MLKLTITANIPANEGDILNSNKVDRQQVHEVLKRFFDELEAGLYTSLVITIVRVQS